MLDRATKGSRPRQRWLPIRSTPSLWDILPRDDAPGIHFTGNVDVKTLELDTLGESRDIRAADADGSVGDAELIERAKTDPEAFGRLFEAYYDRIITYTYRCSLNLAVAEDLTSNTFFKALRGLPKYRHRVSFLAWLYRIAANEVRMHWRSESRRRTTAHNRALSQTLIPFTSNHRQSKPKRIVWRECVRTPVCTIY